MTARTKKQKPKELWTTAQQDAARTEGWCLEWVFMPNGKPLGMQAFPLGSDASIADVRKHIRSQAQNRRSLHLEALRAIVHSKVGV